MNISLNAHDFSIDNVYFSEPIKNSIIENSNFIRLVYSNSLMTLNGIYIKIDFENIYKINDFAKHKITINPNENQRIINFMRSIENDILEKYNIENKNQHNKIHQTTKQKVYKINEQLMSGYIKHVVDTNKFGNFFILKISGIWESEKEYGLTFKFIEVNHS